MLIPFCKFLLRVSDPRSLRLKRPRAYVKPTSPRPLINGAYPSDEFKLVPTYRKTWFPAMNLKFNVLEINCSLYTKVDTQMNKKCARRFSLFQ